MENNVCELTLEEKIAVQNYVKHTDISPDVKLLVYRILFLNTEAKDKCCYARNGYFAKDLGKSERTVRRHLKYLKDIDFISTTIIRKGKYIVSRVIHIAQSLVEKAIKFAKKTAQKAKAKKAHSKANGHQYGLSSEVSKDKEKDDILLRNISQKERISRKSRPANYDELLKFWTDKKLEGTARTFWRYNTKRAWADIRNWKRAAIGWAKKAKDNLAAFKANKTKHTEQSYSVYNEILPELSYNSWDML